MSVRSRTEYEDFRAYCRTLTDSQVIEVVHKEREGARRDRDRDPHFQAAMDEATARRLDWREIR